MLYPLKFRPLFKERIWGGRALAEKMGKVLPTEGKYGESWELSALQGDVSVVVNGDLKGNSLEELIEVYMGDLVGEHVYEKFGVEFPLLIKLLDASDMFSIQVHPDDQTAQERHNSYGKTELWYVVNCQQNSSMLLGFKEPVTKEQYLEALHEGKLQSLLNNTEVNPGDAFYIPPGTIHSAGKGMLIAEIQQTSDITYRLEDWGRLDAEGNPRELHNDLAEDIIDYSQSGSLKITPTPQCNEVVKIKDCGYFTTNILKVKDCTERDYSQLDSFVIYICLEGSLTIGYSSGTEPIGQGETVLIPAVEDIIELDGDGTVLEIFINR